MFVGCDPDLHRTSIAVIADDEAGKPKLAGVFVCSTDLRVAHKLAIVDQVYQITQLFTSGKFPADWLSRVKACMVEHPEIAYTAAQGKNPADLLKIVWPAGCFLGMAIGLFTNAICGIPSPVEWKGNVPKDVNQARTYNALGLSCGKIGSNKGAAYQKPYNVEHVAGYDTIRGSVDWKHLGDAVGIALYARKKFLVGERIQALGGRIQDNPTLSLITQETVPILKKNRRRGKTTQSLISYTDKFVNGGSRIIKE